MDKDHEGGEVLPTMKNFPNGKIRKLNYIIHNPNTIEDTTKVLLDILVQANAEKVEKALRELSDCDDGVSKFLGKKLRSLKLFDFRDLVFVECC